VRYTSVLLDLMTREGLRTDSPSGSTPPLHTTGQGHAALSLLLGTEGRI